MPFTTSCQMELLEPPSSCLKSLEGHAEQTWGDRSQRLALSPQRVLRTDYATSKVTNH